MMVVMAAWYQNYEKLKRKMDIFKKSAFTALEFELVSSGQKSIVAELDVLLSGYHKETHYRIGLDIDLEDEKKNKLIIQPYPRLRPGIQYPQQISELAAEL